MKPLLPSRLARWGRHAAQRRQKHGAAQGSAQHVGAGRKTRTSPDNPTCNRPGTSIDVYFYEQYMRDLRRKDQAGMRKREEELDEAPKTKRGNGSKKKRPKEAGILANVKDETIPPLNEFELFASCLPGLEPILYQELVSLGFCPEYPSARAMKIRKKDADKSDDKTADKTAASQRPWYPRGGGVSFRVTSAESIRKCHLFLGSTSHILLRCGDPFQARGMEELRRKVSKMIFWKQYLKKDGNQPQFDIRVSASKSRLFHTTGIAERVERGILDALGFDLGGDGARKVQTGYGDDASDTIKLVVRVHRDFVQISVDTSDAPLHRRGYRLVSTKSPLREDIAYALLFSAGWGHVRESRDASQSRALLDPFCGSGTIAIEGAAMASGLPPGRLLSTPLKGSKFADNIAWERLLSQAETNAQANGFSIFGSDRNSGAIDASRSNAERAGVSELIKFERHAIRSTPWLCNPTKANPGLLVATNPPFGIRLSPSKHRSKGGLDLLPLYQNLGRLISGLHEEPRVAILAHDIDLIRKAGLKNLSVAFNTKHGGLPVVAMTTTP